MSSSPSSRAATRSELGTPIAVTGIGCWYPGARTPLQLWENILSRRLEFRSIPDNRLPLADYCDPSGEHVDKSYAKRVAMMDGFEFDWAGRRIPKSMYESTDVVHWLSVEVAQQALTDAGYDKSTLDNDGTGVIVGNTLTGDSTRAACMRLRWPFVKRALHASGKAHGLPLDLMETLEGSMETLYKSAFAEPTADSLAGGLANTIAGRVCNYFDLHGGGYIVDGACSSSLLAVCTAGRALSTGDLNVALVGGVDLSIDPFELVGFSRAGALSRGDMNVYDKSAAGFIAGEGCGFVVMKRFEDAQREGDQIYAVMNGWGISSDGKGGIMTPSSSGQAMAIRRAYAGAAYSPADLDFVEGHGTGTRVGDQIELKGVFEAQTNGKPAPKRRTGMTSLKSIIGHTKAAAGIGAFIKATMAVNRRVLPPTGSCTDPNPVFNDTCHSLYPLIYGQVADPNTKLRAGVSAMGFGGINSHVTLESAGVPNPKIAPSINESALLVGNQTSEVFVFTAATTDQLLVETKHLLASADRLSCSDLIDLSAELSLRAANTQPIRAALIAGSVDAFIDRLRSLRDLVGTSAPEAGQVTSTPERHVWLSNRCEKSRVGFLFPGQGAQQLLMSRKLVARYHWAREMVAAADRVQAAAGLPTLSETVFADVQRGIDRDQQTEMRKSLARTEVAQIAIVTTSMIYSHYLKTMGIKPAVCGGHSLGELAALHQAGAFDFESLLQLVSLRGRAMASPAGQAGAMAALFCSREQAESMIAETPGYAVLANINSPNQVVVSGDVDAITAIMQTATVKEVSSARLNVSNAFHSKYVQPAADLLRQQSPVTQHPRQLNIDVFSGMNGNAFANETDLHDYLSQQVVESVDFVSMVQAVEIQCDLLIEVGPNQVLSKLANEILTETDVESQPTASDPNADCDMNRVLAKAFAHGVDVQWNKLFDARLTRPFVPADERKFIGNPCENDFVDLGPVKQLTVSGLTSKSMNRISMLVEDSDSTKCFGGNHSAESSQLLGNGRADDGMPSQNGSTNRLTSEQMAPSDHSTPAHMQVQSGEDHQPIEMIQKAPEATPALPAIDDGIEQVIVDIIHERTGFPKESLTSDLRLLDDLNLDSIKAGDVIASAARKLGALGPIDPASLGNATIGDVVVAVREAKNGDATMPEPAPMMQSEPAMPANAPAMERPAATPTPEPVMAMKEGMEDDGIEAVIIDIIHDRTGFPQDTLTSDLRLLDDLNMDSIKAGDVVASAARKLGALGPIDPASLANATIGDVVIAVRQAQTGDAEAMPSAKDSVAPVVPTPSQAMAPAAIANGMTNGMLPAPNRSAMPQPSMPSPAVPAASMPTQNSPNTQSSASSSSNDWVRNFQLELVTHRPQAKQQDISNNHYRVLYDPSRMEFIQLLQRRFHERGATVSFENYDGGQVTGDTYADGQPYFVIAILPKDSEMMGTPRDRLQRMIHRLRRSVEGTNPVSAQPLATGVAFVQFGNGRFGTCGKNDIESCTAASFARALHLESAALQVRIIDFDDTLSDFLATDFITNEVAAVGKFRDAGFDNLGRRYETRHRLVQPSERKPMPLNLGSNDVIVVSGGAKGITAECALAMAEKTGANFALVGSSPVCNEVKASLQRFAAFDGRCEYFTCNLTDENAVRQLVADVEGRLGKITGLVHGAGRNTPGPASSATGDAVLNEIAPKVLGATNLLDALANHQLRCLVGLTSIIGVTGIPGNAWYAFSNETLDLLLRQYRNAHPETLVRSVSFSAWSDVGMGARGQVETALRRMGVGLIPPNEGVSRFMYALEHDLSDPQLIVTGALGDIDTWRPSGRDKCSGKLRYVDNITNFQPGVTLTTRTTLSMQDDPYLMDHIYDGTCLFPAVFGLEAMSQVASHLMNEPTTLVRIENVELSQPIIVGQEGVVDLQITADACETCPVSGEMVVKVGIRSERTQFQSDHFACDVIFGTPAVGPREQEKVGEQLDIDPQRDLYTGILFQGPRFQRWGDTYQLQEGKLTFDVAHCSHTCNGTEVFGSNVTSGPLLTGDPFYRDVLLQSVQAVIPQKTGLPLSIEKIEFFAPAKEGEQANRRLVTSTLHVIADQVGKEHVCEVVAKDPFGEVRERMTGYRVKVLAIQEEYPTAAQLANLGSFDQSLFDKQTMSIFDNFGATSPVMTLRRMPDLHNMPKASRHLVEKPMMEETVARLQQRSGNANGTPMIDWMNTGRPVVTSDSACKLSLTHDDDYCLCIANADLAGCDLAPITERSHDQWAALVGGHNEPLLDQLIAQGDCINQAGTRIWAAVEATQKAIDDATPVSLRLGASKDGSVTFVTDQLDSGSVLITTPISLHRKPARILAVVAPSREGVSAPSKMQASMMPATQGSVDQGSGVLVPAMPMGVMNHGASAPAMQNGSSQLLMPAQPMSAALPSAEPAAAAMVATATREASPTMNAAASMAKAEPALRSDVAIRGEERAIDNVKAHIKWDGPRDQAVFEHRFVVTFKECATRGKHVQHTQYLSWMGSMRENGLLYLVPDMVIKLSDGLSGMATNWTDIDVVGEAMMGDVIVARLFMEEMTDSTVCLCCDFTKALADGRFERLGTVRQATTWVRLSGKSEPVKEPFPKFLFDAFKSMEPSPDADGMLPELPASLGRLKLEQQKLEAITKHEAKVLHQEDFSTCMDDSNIVANIYYSRYFSWQWRTSDLFLFSKVPQLVSAIVELGNVRELVPLNNHIDFVRDGFPFDKIRTELALVRCTESAATFQYTHYRVSENNAQEKLCVGTQDVVWVRRTPSGTPVPEPFPLAVREAFNGL